MLPGVVNYNVAVWEDGKTVSFLHEIVRGGTNRSYGIHVAKLAGMPAPVVERATALLESFESGRSGRNMEVISDETLAESAIKNNMPDHIEDETESGGEIENFNESSYQKPEEETAGAEASAVSEDQEKTAFEEELKKDEPGEISQLELF